MSLYSPWLSKNSPVSEYCNSYFFSQCLFLVLILSSAHLYFLVEITHYRYVILHTTIRAFAQRIVLAWFTATQPPSSSVYRNKRMYELHQSSITAPTVYGRYSVVFPLLALMYIIQAARRNLPVGNAICSQRIHTNACLATVTVGYKWCGDVVASLRINLRRRVVALLTRWIHHIFLSGHSRLHLSIHPSIRSCPATFTAFACRSNIQRVLALS